MGKFGDFLKGKGRANKASEGAAGPSAGPSSAPAATLNSSTASNGSQLYRMWDGIKGRVPLGGTKYWAVDTSKGDSEAFSTAEFYGCTIVLIADGKHALIGHYPEESGDKIVMEDEGKIETCILQHLRNNLDFWDLDHNCHAWIIHSDSASTKSLGYSTIRNFLQEYSEHKMQDNIHNKFYNRSAGTGSFPDSAKGKAVLQWTPNATGVVVSVYIEKENPIATLSYNSSGNLESGP